MSATDIPETVRFLADLATCSAAFERNPRAKRLWAKHEAALGPFPTCFASLSNGLADIEGLVINGHNDPRFPEYGGWCFDSTVIILCEDGEIIRVNGWLATDVVVR